MAEKTKTENGHSTVVVFTVGYPVASNVATVASGNKTHGVITPSFYVYGRQSGNSALPLSDR